MAHLISPNRPAQIQPFEVVFVALHDRQLRASQIGAGQVRASQVRPGQIRASHVGGREVAPAKIGVRQVAPAKIGPADHSAMADALDSRQRRGVRRLAFAQKRGVISHAHANGQRVEHRGRSDLIVDQCADVVHQAEPPTGDASAVL